MVMCVPQLMKGDNLQIREHLVTMLVAAILMSCAAMAIGANLGTFLAGLVLVAIAVPLLAAGRRSWLVRLLAAGSIADAAALVWLVVALANEPFTIWQWLKAYLLLLSLALLACGLPGLWRLARFSALSAGGLTVLLLALWLTAPVWLFHHLQSDALIDWMQRLIDIHPLFAMNATVESGIWTESPLAYRVLNLNQDVFYAMPGGPWKSILFHGVLGALFLPVGDDIV